MPIQEENLIDTSRPANIPYFEKIDLPMEDTYDQMVGTIKSAIDRENLRHDFTTRQISVTGELDQKRTVKFDIEVQMQKKSSGSELYYCWFVPLIQEYAGNTKYRQVCCQPKAHLRGTKLNLQPLRYGKKGDDVGFFPLDDIEEPILFKVTNCGLSKILDILYIKISSLSLEEPIVIKIEYTIINFGIPSKKGNHVIWFFRALTASPDNVSLSLLFPEKYSTKNRVMLLHPNLDIRPGAHKNVLDFPKLGRFGERFETGAFCSYKYCSETRRAVQYLIIGTGLGVICKDVPWLVARFIELFSYLKEGIVNAFR